MCKTMVVLFAALYFSGFQRLVSDGLRFTEFLGNQSSSKTTAKLNNTCIRGQFRKTLWDFRLHAFVLQKTETSPGLNDFSSNASLQDKGSNASSSGYPQVSQQAEVG